MGAQEELYWHVAITLSVFEFQSAAAKADKMASKKVKQYLGSIFTVHGVPL